MSQLPGELDAKRVLRALARLGWVVYSIRDSHFHLVNLETGKKLTLAHHGVVRRPAMAKTLGIAGIDVETFLEAY